MTKVVNIKVTKRTIKQSIKGILDQLRNIKSSIA